MDNTDTQHPAINKKPTKEVNKRQKAQQVQKEAKKKTSTLNWVVPSVIAAAAYGTSSFLIYVLNRRSGRFNSAAMNLAVYFIICLLSLGLMGLNSRKLIGSSKSSIFNDFNTNIREILTTPKFISLVLAIAATTVIGNIALYASYRLAPNPGFCDVISSSSAFVTLLLGIMLFGQKAKLVNVVGMLMLFGAGYLILA